MKATLADVWFRQHAKHLTSSRRLSGFAQTGCSTRAGIQAYVQTDASWRAADAVEHVADDGTNTTYTYEAARSPAPEDG